MNKLPLLLVTATAVVLVSCGDGSTSPEVQGGASALVPVSGDDQSGGILARLPDSLVVAVLNRSGDPVPDVTVSFTVTAGGGSVSAGQATTGGNGQAVTHWTLGPEAGVQTVAASAEGLTGSPVHFSATAVSLFVSRVAPDTLLAGSSVTITGVGFDPAPANNVVTIDGVPATVTAATDTTLQVTVPAELCRPAGRVGVQVAVDGVASNTAAAYSRPAAYLDLPVGQQLILLDPANFCLQFAATDASEAYLIGVQSAGMDAAVLTPTRLIAQAAAGESSSPLPSLSQSSRLSVFPADPDSEAWQDHRQAEREIRRFEERMLAQLPANFSTGGGGVTGAIAVDSTVAVGDTLRSVRMRDQSGSSCNDFVTITTVVRAISTRSIWVEDVEGEGGYTKAEYESLGAWMDDLVYDVVVSYFGEPGDRDDNGRIVIVVTPGIPNHVSICDSFSREQMAASNAGEFIWFRKPLEGQSGPILRQLPSTLAHELTHVIQQGRRGIEGRLDARWLWEGQAVLAQEVVGHAAGGRVPGKNYDYDVAYGVDDPGDPAWYTSKFSGLARYFGFNGETKHAAAPHECTWIGDRFEGNDGPCSGSQIYYPPWSLFRWALDHFGPGYPGGEAALSRDLTGHPAEGMANLSQVVAVSADTLLAQWSAALYVDDRVEGAHPRLTFSSWNLQDIFGWLPEIYRLTPTEAGFVDLDLARNVRDGSTAYFRISGAGRPAVAIEARSGAGAALASKMNLWIVRLQ